MDKSNIWFIADLHIGHKNILFHQPNRIEPMSLKDDKDIEGHDSYIVETWLSQTKENDHIYVLGDMIMGSQEFAIRVLNRLKSNGCKIHLLVGNHDKSIRRMTNMFESIDLIKRVVFKKNEFEFGEVQSVNSFDFDQFNAMKEEDEGTATIGGYSSSYSGFGGSSYSNKNFVFFSPTNYEEIKKLVEYFIVFS